MQVSIALRDLIVVPAVWFALIGLYLWRPVAGLMALSALGGFVIAQHWPRLGLHR